MRIRIIRTINIFLIYMSLSIEKKGNMHKCHYYLPANVGDDLGNSPIVIIYFVAYGKACSSIS